jgi:heme exporter protein C
MWHKITSLISPKIFYQFANALLPWMTALFLLTFSYGLIGGLLLAPPDYQQGDGFRIIYVHVPCAFLSLFIYGMMASAAFTALVWRIKMAFLVIKHSAPIGAGFTFLALLTGSLWGKPMWGTWWIWDARLTSELILLFLYLGIMLFQSATGQKRTGGRAVAILILVGFVDLPIIHYSVYWWNTLHQGSTLRLFSPSAIDNSMLYPLLAMIVAFLLYYAIILFMHIRHDLIALTSNHHWLKGKSA